MTAHRSFSDADVDAIEARAEFWQRWAPTRNAAETVTLCAEVRRLRAIVAALTTEPPDVECARCGLTTRIDQVRDWLGEHLCIDCYADA